MTENDLERMKDLPVPAPRAEAKARALAAARAAFSTSAASASAGADDNGDSSAATQGVVNATRPTHAFPNTRRKWMRVSNSYAMAASIAALCVAAPAAYHFTRTDSERLANRFQPAEPLDSSKLAKVGTPGAGTTTVTVTEAVSPELKLKEVAPGSPQENLARQSAGAPSDHKQNGQIADTGTTAPVVRRDSPAGKAGGSGPANSRDEKRERAESDRLAGARVDQLQRLGAQQPSLDGRVAAAPPPAASPVTVMPAVRAPSLPYAALPQDAAKSRLGGQIAAIAPPAPPRDAIPQQHVDHGRDQFESKETNPVRQVAAEPVSTFSIDVDTASYSFVRRSLNSGRLPPKDAVRVEEMINYFPYDYARAESADAPFRASVQVFPSPWNANNQLVHIGLKGYDLKSAERPRANLVFLVDISGSMAPADRLPLLKNAFRLLLDNLRPEDTVAIVTYAAGSDIRLQPTKVADKARIIAAIDSLNASGSTHGAAGINDAYKVAEANFDKAAVNRVILATDGDWNVGITNRDELKGFVERKRQTGIYLSILGVGMGNHNDALMQALAQNGNGAAAYIDTLSEARKVLVDEASSTLFPIAKDVKIQLEFNPARVSEYRLIGYESRMLKREDFNNDKVDAGDVGSGHSVTAIYEITPVGAQKLADSLRYQSQPAAQPVRPAAGDDKKAEIGFLKLRYKLPKEEASRLTEFVIGSDQTRRTTAEASTEARFSTAVAAFGQLLRGTPYMQGYTWDDVVALANGAKGEDPYGYRAEFVNLVRLAKSASANVGPR